MVGHPESGLLPHRGSATRMGVRKPSWGGAVPGQLSRTGRLAAVWELGGHTCAGMGSAPDDTAEANASLLWHFLGLWSWRRHSRAGFALKEPWADVRGHGFLS